LDTLGGGEERRYVWLALMMQQTSIGWAKMQADALCAELSDKSIGNGLERQAAEDELTMLQADLREWEWLKQCIRMDDGQLRTRSAEKRALLGRAKEQGAADLNDAWWARSLVELALRKAELLGDLRWIEAQEGTCELTEQHFHANRRSRQQERIKAWQKNAATAEVRIEMLLMDTI
jgi:hypothetical protein